MADMKFTGTVIWNMCVLNLSFKRYTLLFSKTATSYGKNSKVNLLAQTRWKYCVNWLKKVNFHYNLRRCHNEYQTISRQLCYLYKYYVKCITVSKKGGYATTKRNISLYFKVWKIFWLEYCVQYALKIIR